MSQFNVTNGWLFHNITTGVNYFTMYYNFTINITRISYLNAGTTYWYPANVTGEYICSTGKCTSCVAGYTLSGTFSCIAQKSITFYNILYNPPNLTVPLIVSNNNNTNNITNTTNSTNLTNLNNLTNLTNLTNLNNLTNLTNTTNSSNTNITNITNITNQTYLNNSAIILNISVTDINK
jgi:hypothetical protein